MVLPLTKIQEGNHLSKDILEKLDGMYRKVELVEKRSPEILKEYREKLENKTKELLADAQIEESRIAAEVILFADKICTERNRKIKKPYQSHEKGTHGRRRCRKKNGFYCTGNES